VKVLLTGTGAADGVPGYFSDSELSRFARRHGGKDVRLRSAALIDGVLKIDFGPDTFAQCAALGLSALEWKYIVFTHSHDDHFAPRELQYAFPPFLPPETPTPRVYGNQAILDGIGAAFEMAQNLEMTLTKSFEATKVGEYVLTPIRAYHKLDEDSQNLIIQKDGATFLYGTDTGIYQDETWEFLQGWQFDAAVMECTDGFKPLDYWGHLSCAELIDVITRLREMGCFSEKTYICTTHHAHTGMATHAQLEECLNPHGVDVGFDGKVFEL
jgi:phosphoribosyl 1,2-cyclic phosphate phosphodiesterase